MTKEALIIIDMLNDFVEEGAPLEVLAARAIIPRIQKRIREARYCDTLIIYICDLHIPHDKEFTKWPLHALKGTRGAEIIKELKPNREDIIIVKGRYSGFLNTTLSGILKHFEIEKIHIAGILTNVCVFLTAVEASMRDYEVFVWGDSTAALSEADHRTALDQLERVLKIKVI